MNYSLILSTISALSLMVGCGSKGPTKGSIHTNVQNSQTPPTEVASKAPTIKVFVENSGSMYGYVKGKTDFETAVYSFLSDIQHAELGLKSDSTSLKNTLELNYINSITLHQEPDLKEFIKALEPDDFKLKGGNQGTSDMAKIIDSIVSQTAIDDVSIFVSDCIFSPGNQYRQHDNADEYLVSQQIDIKATISERLKIDSSFAAVVMQLTSQFKGLYYNKFDERTSIDSERPFYIWLMGNSGQIKKILDTVKVENIKGKGVKNIFMVSNPTKKLPYQILANNSVGKMKPDISDPKTTITNAKPQKKGGVKQFQVAIGVDFSKSLLPEDYILDVNNYSVSNKAYSLEIVKNPIKTAHTHILKLTLTDAIIAKGTITISLNRSLPNWITEYTDTDGLDINAEGAMNKTYGLKYLIEGIYEAYPSDNGHGTITINIK